MGGLGGVSGSVRALAAWWYPPLPGVKGGFVFRWYKGGSVYKGGTPYAIIFRDVPGGWVFTLLLCDQVLDSQMQ